MEDHAFFYLHPDFTVGFGIATQLCIERDSPNRQTAFCKTEFHTGLQNTLALGLYRRWGNYPRLERKNIQLNFVFEIPNFFRSSSDTCAAIIKLALFG